MTTGETAAQNANQAPRNFNELQTTLAVIVEANPIDPETAEVKKAEVEKKFKHPTTAVVAPYGWVERGMPFAENPNVDFKPSIAEFFGKLQPVATFVLQQNSVNEDEQAQLDQGFRPTRWGVSEPDRFVRAEGFDPYLADVHMTDAPYKVRTTVDVYTRENKATGDSETVYSVGDEFVRVWWLGGTDFQTTRLVEEVEPERNYSTLAGYSGERSSSVEQAFALGMLMTLANSDKPDLSWRDHYSVVDQTSSIEPSDELNSESN